MPKDDSMSTKEAGRLGGEKGGQKGGQAALHSEKVSAAQLAQYMKGVDFPADKKAIVRQAKSNGAPDNVMEYLNELPEREYKYPTDVEQEFGKLKKH